MLAPESRALLLDALRPPPGSRVDHCVATTFTLDLTTALLVPIALAGFELSGEPDPIAMLEALRSTAGRFDVFCQAGMISAAGVPNDLVALLEASVHQVRRPRPGHLFHPKVWLLRYSGPGAPTYRCVVASRNLTADRSWDVMLRLDGVRSTGAAGPVNDNAGLAALLHSLPATVVSPLDSIRQQRIQHLANDLRDVEWELPDGVEAARFHTFGVAGHSAPDLTALFGGSRHLVISPFLTAGGVDLLRGRSAQTDMTIVSRAEEYDRLVPEQLHGAAIHTLDPLAAVEPDGGELDHGGIRGNLHAKVYVVESSRRAHVFVGSANATDGAFNGNVEILCQLTGRRKQLGIDRFLDKDDGLQPLLQPYTLPPVPTADPVGETTRRLEALLVDIAQVGFAAEAGEEPGDTGRWAVTLASTDPLPEVHSGWNVRLYLAPYNAPAERYGLQLGARVALQLASRPAAQLTPFFTVHASARIDGVTVDRSTIIAARLVGGPHDRLDAIIASHLNSPERFLQFLMLVLSYTDGAAVGVDAAAGAGTGTWRSTTSSGLLELLTRALATNPEAIDRLDSVVQRLAATTTGVLPIGWEDVWPAVLAARTQTKAAP